MVRFLILHLVAFLFLVPPAFAESRKLVFLGDSLTAGYNLASDQAFPAFVKKKIAAAKLVGSWEVVNAGVSGDTTAGGKSRLRWILKSKPSVVFVCLGANDGLRGLKHADIERNLRGIIGTLKEAKVRVVLGGVLLPGNYGAEYAEKFSQIFSRVAKDESVPLVPFLLDGVATNDKLMLPDRLHPNAAGAERIAENVWPVLEPVLKEFDGK